MFPGNRIPGVLRQLTGVLRRKDLLQKFQLDRSTGRTGCGAAKTGSPAVHLISLSTFFWQGGHILLNVFQP